MIRYDNNKDTKVVFGIKFFYIILIILPNYIIAQKPEEQSKIFSIEFVRSITGKEDYYSKNILDQASDFIFGDNLEDFIKPVNICVKDTSEFWVLDQGIKNVININIKNGVFQKITTNSEFPSLIGICRVNYEKLIFSDSKNNTVYSYNNIDDKLDVLITSEKKNKPTGIAFNNIKNEIWIVQTGSHSIMVFDINGKPVNEIGKRGNKELEFNFPTHIWIDNKGFVYIVDSMNFRVQILNQNGEFISMFGEHGDATGYFARPKGIATDSFGNIYIVDALFHNVQIFNKEGKFLNYFGNQGKKEKEFWLPQGIFIDQNDRIYIADSYNSRIQTFEIKAVNK